VGHHKKIAAAQTDYLKVINVGDICGVAHCLKVARYYTAPEADYAKGMASQRKIIDQSLGPVR
jgi:hypothetical protein